MSALTLADRAEIVASVWPEPSHIAQLLIRCVLVYDIETGYPTPMLSPQEAARIREEIGKRATPGDVPAPVTIDPYLPARESDGPASTKGVHRLPCKIGAFDAQNNYGNAQKHWYH